MSISVTIMGCGSSGGVPRIGNFWGECDPENPRNLRQRCSLLVRHKDTSVIIDTAPDLRVQMLQNKVATVDGVLYTHPHADHIHGIDDLRVAAMNAGEKVNVWADEPTGAMLEKRFGYCFKTPENSAYPPILTMNRLVAGQPVTIGKADAQIEFLPFNVNHGQIFSLGFRFNNIAYTPDINGVPDESLEALSGLDLWIVDALRRTPHPTHFSLGDALEWIDRLKPKRAIITNMHVDLDYQTLCDELPENVTPAHDGLQLTL